MSDIIDPSPAQVLACPMGPNDADASTIGAYLIALLAELWREGGNFSGKKPFGNSGWDGDLAKALIRACYVEGEIDDDGYLDGYDDKRVDQLVAEAIKSLQPAPPEPEADELMSRPGTFVVTSAHRLLVGAPRERVPKTEALDLAQAFYRDEVAYAARALADIDAGRATVEHEGATA